MDLDRISIVLRPRAPREALDLGAVMLRANAGAVWSAWFVFTLPVFVLCNALGVLSGLPWLGMVLVWWLKPLFDRLPLFVLSRAVFDHAPGWRETLRGQWHWGWRSTLASLTWLRIDSSRALRLPMELLEGAPRRQRAARWKVLRRRIVTDVTMLTYGCLQFELVLFLSVCLLALLLVPHEWRPESFSGFFRHDIRGAVTVWWLLAAALAYLAMSVIEPLYVACGFAMYLNRRTQLEAWDIDLAFQRLRSRLQALGKVLLVLLVLGSSMPSPVRADAAAPPARKTSMSLPEQVFDQPLDSRDQAFAEAASEAYRDRHFGGEHTSRQWVLRDRFKPSDSRSSVPFEGFGQGLAAVLNMVLWLLLASVVVALFYFAWRWRGRLMPSKDAPEAPLAQAQQLADAAEAPLPKDVATAARALWLAQRRREALALLYRGCVAQTAGLLQLPLSAESTEADWLRQAANISDPARRQRVVTIVRTWQFAAYADRFPADADLENLLEGWPAQAEASS